MLTQTFTAVNLINIQFCPLTILVPGEAVSELLTLILHIQTDGNKLFLLVGIVMDTSWISVIKTENHQNTDTCYNL